MRRRSGLFSRDAVAAVPGVSGSGSASGSASTNNTDGGDRPAITHFVILVPGTGPHREDEKPKGSFMKKAKKMREVFQETCRREFSETGANVEMVPIDYHADMQALETTNQRMAKATLPSIPWIRTMDNEVIGDILYYFSTFHGRRMLEMVITKLNAAYDSFVLANPGFSGPVSLVAHSLGGMVCYEILYYMNMLASGQTRPSAAAGCESERYRGLPPLRFAPDRLFTMGSPIGGTIVFRNLSMADYNMGPVGYHNIFHPFDPFGYRTEPLYDDFYADVAAVPVTAAKNGDRQQHDSGHSHNHGHIVGGLWKRSNESSVTHGWTRHLSLSESMSDLRRNVFDAVALAPVTLLGAVRWAARSSVALPISTVASKVGGGARRRESLDLGRLSKRTTDHDRPQHLRRRTFFGLSTNETHHRSDDPGAAAVAGGAKEEPAAAAVGLEESLPRSRRVHHARRRSFSRFLPSFKTFSFGSSRADADSHGNEMSSGAPRPVSSTAAADTADDGSLDPSDSADREATAKPGSSPSTLSFMSLAVSSHLAATASVLAASESPAAAAPATNNENNEQAPVNPEKYKKPSHHVSSAATTASIDGARRLGKMDDIATDDMFGQLLRIFGPSRPPNREQQMAESQGLPLSSKLFAAHKTAASRVSRGGASIRITNTVPLDLSGLATCPPAVGDAAANKNAGDKEQASAVPVCAVNMRTPSGLWIRRANSLPHRSEVPTTPATTGGPAQDAQPDGCPYLYLRPEGTPKPPRRSTTAPAKSPGPTKSRSSASFAHASVQKMAADDSSGSEETSSDTEETQEDEAAGDDAAGDDAATMDAHPLPYAERMDYIIPFTKRHLQNEYWLGFHAHFSYWTSKEIVYHILYHMICNPASKLV